VLGHDVLFPLLLGERDRGDLLGLNEGLDGPQERLGDRLHERRGGKQVAAMMPEEAGHPLLALEPGHVHVEVHPVDALHF
jgi:hypothetical protein